VRPLFAPQFAQPIHSKLIEITMDEPSPDLRPRPLVPTTERIGDDPDGGQVIGPDGESPEDPAARGLFRGCMITWAVIGIIIGILVVLLRTFGVV
jgi:hypothetical protein